MGYCKVWMGRMEGLHTYQLSGSKPRTMHPIYNNYNINNFHIYSHNINNYIFNHYNNNYHYNYNFYNNYNNHNNYNHYINNNSDNYNNNYNDNNNNCFALCYRLYRNNLKMLESFS